MEDGGRLHGAVRGFEGKTLPPQDACQRVFRAGRGNDPDKRTVSRASDQGPRNFPEGGVAPASLRPTIHGPRSATRVRPHETLPGERALLYWQCRKI